MHRNNSSMKPFDLEKEFNDSLPLLMGAIMTKDFSKAIDAGARITRKYMDAHSIKPISEQSEDSLQKQIAKLNAGEEAFITFCLDYLSKRRK